MLSMYNCLIGTEGVSNETLADGGNTIVGTSTGSKIATNSNQKLAFWGATPIVQPAGSGELIGILNNAATNVNATNMTSNGNTGTAAYSFNDVVKALKTAGLLAQ